MKDDRDKIWQRDEIDSPCIKICVIHPEALVCTGCRRCIDDITAWSRMDAETRSTIMAELPSREALLRKRRGGRAARIARGTE